MEEKMFEKRKMRKLAQSYLQILEDLEMLKFQLMQNKGETETTEQMEEINSGLEFIERIQIVLMNMGNSIHGLNIRWEVVEEDE
jgi:hypothetical protein